MRICFICDLHLSENKKTLQYDALRFALDDISKRKPSCICYAGDVTCDGDISVYLDFVKEVESLGIPFCYIPGNSDLRNPLTVDRIKSISSPVKTVIDGRSIFALNDCEVKIDCEALDLIDTAKAGDVVFMHHPIQNFDDETRSRLLLWKETHKDSYIICGHKHVSRISDNEIWLQTLDPDKAIGEAPCINYFDPDTGDMEKTYYFSFVPNDMYSRLGISLYRPIDQIETAIKYGLSSLELRKNIIDLDRGLVLSLIDRWRRAGGKDLSIHLPDVKYIDGEAVCDARLGEYIELSNLLSANRFTQHVPKVSVGEVRADGSVLSRIADVLCRHFEMLDHETVIGIENMHMTASEKPDGTRRFGYTPEECLEFMNTVASKTRHKVGINFDFGHARNNPPYNKTYQIGTWLEMIGKHAVGYHLHQVRNVNGKLENHLAFTEVFGQFICLASFFRAWCIGMANKAPVIFEMRPEDAYETTLSLFKKHKERNASDIHSHTYYSNCSSDDPRKTVMEAYTSGLSLFAITDHRHGIADRVDEYKKTMRCVAEEFKDRIKVLVGLELATLPYKFDPVSYQIADGFDFVIIEHIDEPSSAVGKRLFEFVDKFNIPCGIAHTDLFGYCDLYGLDYKEFFTEMASRGMFWEMNVSYDSTHSYRQHGYVDRFLESEERIKTVREAGVYISVSFDGHDHADYRGERVHRMYDVLKEKNLKTIDELFGGFER